MINYDLLKNLIIKLVKYLTSIFRRKIVLLLIVFVVLLSCEELIDVNLNNVIPKVVIESLITNVDNPFVVKISKSQSFFNQSNFTVVKSAVVQLEYLAVKEKLIEKNGGYYVAARTKGVAGIVYTLNITTAGEAFRATVELPQTVRIDTVYFKPGIFRNDSLNIIVEFQDPVLTDNYYRIKLYRNGRYAVNDYYLMTDTFLDGEKIVAPIYYRYFVPGDTVIVELLNLERNTWRYYKGISESIQQGVNSQAPGNPPSNFSGGALGIFGAGGYSSSRVIVPGATAKK